ncbi:class I adenylate-forming enzyme family protein [Patulibacter sp. SYSU D01012]|uniref:class I adenylate-forming enzyme family protein n=1 Tax=Patulibacter sp. SYSU D01012 TaxID=2817381 RepID=UPI001B31325E
MTPPAPDAAAREHNLADVLLRDALARTPDATAIVQGDRALSFAALDARAGEAAARLRTLGVAPGDRVALLYPNDPGYLVAFLGVLRAGAVVVPLSSRSGRTALGVALEDAAPRLVLAHPDLVALARELRPDALVAPADGPWRDAAGAEAGAPGPDADRSTAPVRPDDVCMQPYTSGSTGRPKGCELSHRGQAWNARASRAAWSIGPTDRGLAAAPLYHANAMICVVEPCLLGGGTIVLAEDPAPAAIPATIERHACTYTTGVPATYEMLLRAGEDEARDLSSLRFVVCGSAPLSPELTRRITGHLGVPVVEAYGLTEGGPQVLVNTPEDPGVPGSAGRPIGDGEVALSALDTPADATDPAPVPDGEVGELWVRNPGVLLRYHGLPEQTAAKVTPSGWLRTGDLARRDAEGRYFIAGRRDDALSVGGETVHPLEVETLLRRAPGVHSAAVVGVPHAVKGQVPVAFVVPRDPAAAPTAQELKDFTLREGAPYAHPRHVWIVEDLPLSGPGKVDKRALTAEAARRTEEEAA